MKHKFPPFTQHLGHTYLLCCCIHWNVCTLKKKVGNLPFPFSLLTKERKEKTKLFLCAKISFSLNRNMQTKFRLFVSFVGFVTHKKSLRLINSKTTVTVLIKSHKLEYKDDDKEQQQKPGLMKCTATTTQSVYMYCNFLQQPRQLQWLYILHKSLGTDTTTLFCILCLDFHPVLTVCASPTFVVKLLVPCSERQ